jgi:tRNA(adenine34) deaminase
MSSALVQARIGAGQGEVPVGAVMADKDFNVISSGCNQVVTLNDPTAHAEMLAMRGAASMISNYRLIDSILVCTLEPCPMCMMAAIHARVKVIIYGAPEPRWGACGSLFDMVTLPGLNHRPDIHGGLMAGECADLVREYFNGRRKMAQFRV